MSSRSIQENDNTLTAADQAVALATVDGIFDSSLVTQPVYHGQHNKKNRPLSKTDYGKVKDVWDELPIGLARAELEAWVGRKMGIAGRRLGSTGAEDLAKLEQLRRLLAVLPEESEWKYIEVYLHCRKEGGKVVLSQEQKDAIGDPKKIKALTKCDEFVTFGKRSESIAKHKTAMELLEMSASSPPPSGGATSKCVSFAQELAEDVHDSGKKYATREAAGQYMKQFREAVVNGQEMGVIRQYEAAGLPTGLPGAAPAAPVSPWKRAWENTGDVMVQAAQKLFHS